MENHGRKEASKAQKQSRLFSALIESCLFHFAPSAPYCGYAI
jgi:hypothetical protein